MKQPPGERLARGSLPSYLDWVAIIPFQKIGSRRPYFGHQQQSSQPDSSHPFSLQKMEASYYDNIMEQQRLEPEFFRVGFYGRKFPFFLRVSPFRWS